MDNTNQYQQPMMDKQMNQNSMMMQNKQERQHCTYFQKNKCSKDNCIYKHQYKVCQLFDQGFCPLGKDCLDKHVYRVLCHDYMYGFCPEGPKCEKAHPKIFLDNDFDFSKQFQKKIHGRDFKIIQCHTCKYYGHKATRDECYEKGFLMDPTKIILCGLCQQKHQVQFECEKYKQLFSQNE